MKLAISNIAWPPEDTPAVLDLLRKEGVKWIEVAPSRVWGEPVDTLPGERKAFVESLEDYGIRVISLHSLLYTRPDLGLFRGEDTDRKTVLYLQQLAELGAELGARWMVFGSPRNRRKGALGFREACDGAARVFGPAGDAAAEAGVTILIEPLTRAEADFVNTADEGIELVKAVGSPGFALHLDAKSVAEEPGEKLALLRRALPFFRHFHINDPDLAPLGSVATYHEELGAALRRSGYRGHVSIEMKTFPDHRQVIARSLALAKRFYMG
ncbi:MAG: sugar phosphate isomerase/epimerase [Methanomicrobiales archaeon]|nr:sugar phosphate isomerase/epimerase [Methanomicrobiales archaeon]